MFVLGSRAPRGSRAPQVSPLGAEYPPFLVGTPRGGDPWGPTGIPACPLSAPLVLLWGPAGLSGPPGVPPPLYIQVSPLFIQVSPFYIQVSPPPEPGWQVSGGTPGSQVSRCPGGGVVLTVRTELWLQLRNQAAAPGCYGHQPASLHLACQPASQHP